MKTNAIIHENGNFFVIKETKGYAVYENNGVSSRRCDVIGSDGEKWLKVAIEKCNKRAQG